MSLISNRTSGAMYRGVPTLLGKLATIKLALPKSASLTRLRFSVSNMLAGLTSRCIIDLLCK
jgi:hypothetical protein